MPRTPFHACSLLTFCCLIGVTASVMSGQEQESGRSTSESHETSEPMKDIQPRWWKGNIHTHSLWSDGDDFPEMIASWYVDHGYNFLALSDHNTLSQGLRWMQVSDIEKRAGKVAMEKYLKRFGPSWVEVRGTPTDDDYAVRLKPLNEFRALVEQAGKFIMLQGEEISDRAEGKPVHMNATNLAQLITPIHGETVRETMQNNLRLVLEQEKELGQEILPHLNHPNFGWAITAEDLAHVIQERFFEVYNGHPGVNHLGDETRPGIERMWDLANAIRLGQLDAEPLLGVATDDSHEYHGEPGSRPGRGWVMVRSMFLTPEHLVRAMKAGDFYCSSGVELSSVTFDEVSKTLSLVVSPQPNASYHIDFIATLRSPTNHAPALETIGQIVSSVDGTTASYTLTGKELYVRAVVTSSQPPVDPVFADQRQQAWTQPVGWQVGK